MRREIDRQLRLRGRRTKTMGCWCDRRKGGAGKANTPYSYHLYYCEFYLNEIADYTYEQFKVDYKKMEEEKKSSEEIRMHFMKKLDDYHAASAYA